MDYIKSLVRREVVKYAVSGRGANVLLFAILDDEQGIYAVNGVDYPERKDIAGVVVLARVVKNMVVIEEDMSDKKLVDALIQAGILRDQIVLAYEGEPIPDADLFELDV
ncbi:MAG: element excision factor XisI family protein [Chloroflexi bacterium]|nr:element excision factor XisI family protein [Chloroflexota bacterium]